MLNKLRERLIDCWNKWRIRNWLHFRLVALYWKLEAYKKVVPSEKTGTTSFIMFEPISMGAILTSLLISGASMAASYAISSLTAPKPKPIVKGKITGEVTLTDSIFGAPQYRIYGGANDGAPSECGVEVGGEVIWLPEIVKIQTTTQQPTGGGKGRGGRAQTVTNISYKCDIGVAFGTGNGGRLKLLRLKLNEDTVYNITGGGTGQPVVSARYEAESESNTLTGSAVVTGDAQCSGGKKVTGIGPGSSLTFNGVDPEDDSLVPEPGDEDIPHPVKYFEIVIRYKSVGDRTATVRLDGAGGVYTFPDTAGVVGIKSILRLYSAGAHTIEFSSASAAGPEIDCIDVSIIFITEEAATNTGARDPLFPSEPEQDNLLIPDPKDFDTSAFERFNAKTIAADGVLEVVLPGGAEMTWYEGTSDQVIDPVVAAQVNAEYGADSCPAFRDIAWCRIRRLDLSKYGSVPNFRALLMNVDLQTVEEILIAEASLVDLTADDFDLSVLASRRSRGYLAQGAPAKAFEDFALIENASFVESSDGRIVAKDLTDRTVVAQINRDDLGAYILDEQDQPPDDDVVVTVEDEIALVREMELSYFNPSQSSDYNTDRVSITFPYTGSRRKETKTVPATLKEDEAMAIVKRELQKHHQKMSAPIAFTTSHKYAWLDAADCVEVEIDGEMKRVRIEEKTGSAPGIFEISATDESIEVFADQGAAASSTKKAQIGSVVKFPANSVGTIIDIPALSEQQEGRAGVYVAACRKGVWGDWAGCGVMREIGGEFGLLATIERECSIGKAVTALGDIPDGYSSDFLDAGASLAVDFYGTFEPTTLLAAQAEDGLGAYVVGNEVCVIKTWTRDNDYPNRWTGTDIYRVLKNTGSKSASHQAGERVVFLDDAVKFVALDRSEIKKDRTWKFVTAKQDVADAAPVPFNWAGDNIYNKIVYSNRDETGTVTRYLPKGAEGLEYGFEVVEAFELSVQATDASSIEILGVTGATVSAEAPGAYIYLEYLGGRWKATQVTGIWEVGA